MLDKFIVIDYQEGAGGEFIANFISSHFGYKLEFDQQANPTHNQKWLNSHSIVTPDWDLNFETYFLRFLSNCKNQSIDKIAVPYHLYKWPSHVKKIKNIVNNARFVKINCEQYLQEIQSDYDRKVLLRVIQDFSELKFLLQCQSKEIVEKALKLYKQKKLTVGDIVSGYNKQLKQLPSNDIEIDYGDFFCNFDQTPHAYQKLCGELDIAPNADLLLKLLERNKKNYQSLKEHLSKI